MSDVYQRALAARQTAEAKIIKLEQQLAALRVDFERANSFIEGWEHFANMTGDSGRAPAPPTPANPPKERVAQEAVRIVREAGRPLSRAEIFEALKARGIHLHGKDPVVVLSTMLWRQKGVIPFIKDVGYWPSDDPLPEEFRSAAFFSDAESEDNVHDESLDLDHLV